MCVCGGGGGVCERERLTDRQRQRDRYTERERIFDFNNPVNRCEVLEFNVLLTA